MKPHTRCLAIGLLFCLAAWPTPEVQAQVTFTDSNLPIVLIDTDTLEIVDEPKIMARMKILHRGPGLRTALADQSNPAAVNYDGWIGIEIRGTKSQEWPKKQYAVETRDADGDDRNVSLLGLPKENDWILSAPYHDKSLLRNVFMYRLAGKLGGYAPRTIYVELVLNGQYQGLYVLTEAIKQDRNRVNIAKLKADDLEGDPLTGGYVIKDDSRQSGGEYEGWVSPYRAPSGDKIRYVYHDPKEERLAPEQRDYIRDFVTDFEALMWGDPAQYTHPTRGYQQFLHVPSFIDFILLNELSKNSDAYRRSVFYHKDRDRNGGKLVAGPIWDFNYSLANASFYGTSHRGWNVNLTDNFVAFWWARLFYEPNFARQFSARWQHLRQTTLSTDSLLFDIDALIEHTAEARVRNFERWPVLGQRLDPGRAGDTLRTTYADEITWLKDWLQDRLRWMDNNLPQATPCAPDVVINEIHYDAPPSINAGDWVELHNRTETDLQLEAWTLRMGHRKQFFVLPQRTLPAGGYLVLAEDTAAFARIFPDMTAYTGPFGGPEGFKLDDEGGIVQLFTFSGCPVSEVRYQAGPPWPSGVIEGGYSIELVGGTDHRMAQNWHRSAVPGGSPGQENPPPDPTHVEATSGLPTAGARLAQNYPNPFGYETRLTVHLDQPQSVHLTIYNALGQRVRTLHAGPLPGGEHTFSWNGTDAQGRRTSAGMYFYTLRTGRGLLTRAMILQQ